MSHLLVQRDVELPNSPNKCVGGLTRCDLMADARNEPIVQAKRTWNPVSIDQDDASSSSRGMNPAASMCCGVHVDLIRVIVASRFVAVE